MATLNKHGYVIDKSALTPDQLSKIKKDLFVTPNVDKDYNTDIKSFKVYRETEKQIILPRFYGLEHFPKPTKIEFGNNKREFKFTKTLRESQVKIANRCIEKIKTTGGGIISLYTGGGKTIIALYIACQLNLKTLVIVNKTFLQNQWYERIKEFTTAKIGTIRQKKTDVKNRDIVVGMLQSISQIDYPESVFEDFDLVIFDEVHRTASEVYSNVFWKTGSRYVIGLSATPVRQDGLTKVIKWFIGDILVKISRKQNSNIIVKRFDYESDDKLFTEKKRCFNGKIKPDVTKMVTNLIENDGRNKFIVEVLNVVRKQEGRKIMILSKRIQHLEVLKSLMDAILKKEEEEGLLDTDEVTTSKYIGKMKQYELDDAAEADIIFATYDMAQEALDIESLNTLLFATPKKDIVQAIGRIMRKPLKVGDIAPMVVDINDILSNFINWGSARYTYYKKNDYSLDIFFAFNNKCVNSKEYLKSRGMLEKDDGREEYIRKFICYKYGAEQYDVEKEEGIKYESYEYDSNLENIFSCDYNVDKDEESGQVIEVW